MSILQNIKNRLVELGPENPIGQAVLSTYARTQGYTVAFGKGVIKVSKDGSCIVLSNLDYTFVPMLMEIYDHFIAEIEPVDFQGITALDFSEQRVQKYRKSGLELLQPRVAEDDAMPAYTRKYTPKPGDVVFDLGAHAGITTVQLSQLVGPGGKVYAFEPDDSARDILLQNLKRYDASNVMVLDLAMGETSAKAMFNMDGSAGASLTDLAIYVDKTKQKEVTVTSLEEFCTREKTVPVYVKADIEGAEIGLIRGATEFLKQNPIHFGFESHHKTKTGTLSFGELEEALRAAGYDAESDKIDGTMFTWGTPPNSLLDVKAGSA